MSARPSFVKKNTSSVEPLRDRPKAQTPSSSNNPSTATGSLRSRSPGKPRPVAQIKNTDVSPREKSPRPHSRNITPGKERAPSNESPRHVSFNNDSKNNQGAKITDSKSTPTASKTRPIAKQKENASTAPVVNKKSDLTKPGNTMQMNVKSSNPEIPKVIVNSSPEETSLTESPVTKINESSEKETSLTQPQNSLPATDTASVDASSKNTDLRNDKIAVPQDNGNHGTIALGTMKSDSSAVVEASDKSLPESKSPILTRPVSIPVNDEPSPNSKHSKKKFKFPGRSKEKSAEKTANPNKIASPNGVEVVTLPKERIEVCIDKALSGFADVHRNLQRHVMSKLQGEVELNTKKPATLAVKTRYHRLKRLEGIMGELNIELSKICDWMRRQEDLPEEVFKPSEQGFLKIEYLLHEINKLWSSVFSGMDKSIEDKMNAFHDLLDRLFTDVVEFVRQINNMKVMRDNNKRIPISNDKMAEIAMSFPMKYIEHPDEKKKHS